jgi:glycosyltransferase involved in cell wall biosynthesis
MARRLGQRLRAPLVFTHHTRFGDYSHYLGPFAQAGRRVTSAYLGDFWRGCAGVVAPGSELAADIANALGARPRPLIRTIPTGVDVHGIAQLPVANVRPDHGWPEDAIVVVSLGRVAEEKNVHVLMEAFAAAAVAEPRLRFLLIGGGPAIEQVRQRAARPDLAERVVLTGRVPHRDALALVRGCDLFAFASQTETQGLVLAEALVAGVPVLALRGPGVADSVRDGVDGLIVEAQPPGTAAAALGAAMMALARDPARRTAMAVAATEGAARFAIERRIGQVVDLYRELLAGR